MSIGVLFVGRTNIVLEEASAQLQMQNVEFFSATNVEEVQAAFQKRSIEYVFMGAGVDLEQRLEIVRAIFRDSATTTVYLKDSASGPEGFLPFVQAILRCLHSEA